MLSDDLFELTLSWSARERGESFLLDQRRAFEARTGPIEEATADYESRIAHFFEWYACRQVEGGAVVSRFARAHPELSAGEQQELAGWLRSHRSLWACEAVAIESGESRIRDLIGGLAVRVSMRSGDEPLRLGDRFDGRVVQVGDRLFLSPGRVFHPRGAHVALDALLAEARASGCLGPQLLDPLLRMRTSFLAFASIRAEHVYRLDAIEQQPGSAPWAARARRKS
jgi:hypothetical protein